MYPELYEQALRKTKYILVNRELDLKAFIPSLSARLQDALKPFLVQHLATLNSEDLTPWLNNLDKVFSSALRLRTQAMLRDQPLYFKWPRAGDSFDYRIMRTESLSEAETLRKVHLALFPALMQKPSTEAITDSSKDRVIFHAVVILQ